MKNEDRLKFARDGDILMAERYCRKILKDIYSGKEKLSHCEERDFEDMLLFGAGNGSSNCIYMGAEYYLHMSAMSISGGREDIDIRLTYYEFLRRYMNMARRISREIKLDPYAARDADGNILCRFSARRVVGRRRKVIKEYDRFII